MSTGKTARVNEILLVILMLGPGEDRKPAFSPLNNTTNLAQMPVYFKEVTFYNRT